jgi:hypothetical protein
VIDAGTDLAGGFGDESSGGQGAEVVSRLKISEHVGRLGDPVDRGHHVDKFDADDAGGDHVVGVDQFVDVGPEELKGSLLLASPERGPGFGGLVGRQRARGEVDAGRFIEVPIGVAVPALERGGVAEGLQRPVQEGWRAVDSISTCQGLTDVSTCLKRPMPSSGPADVISRNRLRRRQDRRGRPPASRRHRSPHDGGDKHHSIGHT